MVTSIESDLLDILSEDTNLSVGKKQSRGVGVRETCAEADLLDILAEDNNLSVAKKQSRVWV